MKPVLKVKKSEAQVKQEQRQAKLAALAEKKAKGKLTLEDVYEQNQLIIEQQEEILKRLTTQ